MTSYTAQQLRDKLAEVGWGNDQMSFLLPMWLRDALLQYLSSEPLKARLAGPLSLLRELTDAAKGSASDSLIGYAFRSHVLSYRRILNEIEYPDAAHDATSRTPISTQHNQET